MKYEVEMSQHVHRKVTVNAKDRDEALDLALIGHEGFDANYVTELSGEDDDPGETHEPAGKCEGCSKQMWEGEDFHEDMESGCRFCGPCWAQGDTTETPA